MDVVNDDPQYAQTGQWEGSGSDGPSTDRSARSDRDVLFGQIALVNGFVNPNTFDKAQRQADNPGRSLAEFLVESGAIGEEDRQASSAVTGFSNVKFWKGG